VARSNSAKTASICTIILPADVVVSKGSVAERKATPALVREGAHSLPSLLAGDVAVQTLRLSLQRIGLVVLVRRDSRVRRDSQGGLLMVPAGSRLGSRRPSRAANLKAFPADAPRGPAGPR
jgi:hypothetical protein